MTPFELILAYREGRLSEAQRKEVEQRLAAGDAELLAEMESHQELDGIIEVAVFAERKERFEALSENLLAENEQRGSTSFLSGSYFKYAVAAVLGLAILGVWYVNRPERPEQLVEKLIASEISFSSKSVRSGMFKGADSLEKRMHFDSLETVLARAIQDEDFVQVEELATRLQGLTASASASQDSLLAKANELRFYKGVAQLRQGKVQEAIQSLTEAQSDHSGDFDQIDYYMALALLRVGNREEAAAYLCPHSSKVNFWKAAEVQKLIRAFEISCEPPSS